jgi:hypothetical protein
VARGEGEGRRLNRPARPKDDGGVTQSRTMAHAGKETRTDRRSEGGVQSSHGARGAALTPTRRGVLDASAGARPRGGVSLRRRGPRAARGVRTPRFGRRAGATRGARRGRRRGAGGTLPGLIC